MKRVFQDWLYGLVGFVAALLSIFSFFSPAWIRTNDEGKWAIIFLGIIGIVLLLDSFINRVFVGRLRRYGETLSDLNIAYASLNAIDTYKGRELATSEKLKRFQDFCDAVSRAFSVITGTSCSTSIKVQISDNDGKSATRKRVFTLARDGNSLNKRQRLRETGTEPKHWIDENSDFLFIINGLRAQHKGKTWYLNNWLPLATDYKNTSFEAYGKPLPHGILRYLYWPLPYRSTIVAPICALETIKRRKNPDSLLGFLCIDSPNVAAFKKSYDLDLVQGLADAVFRTLRQSDVEQLMRSAAEG
jgi:hypothetical protein